MHTRGISPRVCGCFISGLSVCLLSSQARAFTILPTWDASISAGAQTDIQSAINLYQAQFTDNVTVKVYVQAGGGLGSNTSTIYQSSYSTFHNALSADGSTADDTAALSQLNSNPYGGANMIFTSANGRALGFNTPGALTVGAVTDYDSVITLNTSLCFLNHNSPVAGQYDLFAVFLHELDEAMGTISGVGGGTGFAADLFRYNGSGARSFTTNTGEHAYFSIDGTTNIVEYNQFGRTQGDWGDWMIHTPPQVQDWAGTPGLTINPGESEYRLLDVVGYNRPVPEPASLAVLGLGAAALIRRKRSR